MELVEGTTTVDDVDAFVEELAAIGADRGCAVQAFDARYVAGADHLRRAVALADRARERGEAIARDRAVEILLYAAGRRQIDRALEMGVGEGARPTVVLVDAGERDEEGADRERAAAEAVRGLAAFEPGEALSASDPERLREFFGITDPERAATDATLEALVCERVALLTVER